MNEIQNTPELRFEGFTEPWEQQKLRDTAESYSGGTPTSGNTEYYGGDIPFIRSAEISSDTTELSISRKGYESSAARMVKPGDVLFALYGAPSGEVAISKMSGAINQAILAILPSPMCDAFFLAAWLRRQKDEIVATYLQGGQGNLSATIVKGLDVPVPVIEEQRCIGTLFSRLDSLIALYQRKYERLQHMKQALLLKMFPKPGEQVPELRFEGFTEPWKERKLGELVDVCNGRDYKHLDKGVIPVYGTGGYMTSVSEALSYSKDAIGIGRKGTIDRPYILRAPFWTVDTLFYAIPQHEVDLDFAFCLFSNINWRSKDESSGVPSLSKQAIDTTRAKVPGTDEQRIIGTFFRNLDSLIALQQSKYERLQHLKQALLQKMFA